MPELWVPGAAAPSLEDFVERLQKQIEAYAAAAGGHAGVEVELHDGSVLKLLGIAPEPGYGFVTLLPHGEEGGDPERLIIPVGSIVRIRLSRPEEHLRFGFAAPEKRKPKR